MVDYGSEITGRIKGKSQLVEFIWDFILNPIGPSFSFYPAGGLYRLLSDKQTNGPPPNIFDEAKTHGYPKSWLSEIMVKVEN